jgi:hypothetical protein
MVGSMGRDTPMSSTKPWRLPAAASALVTRTLSSMEPNAYRATLLKVGQVERLLDGGEGQGK